MIFVRMALHKIPALTAGVLQIVTFRKQWDNAPVGKGRESRERGHIGVRIIGGNYLRRKKALKAKLAEPNVQ